VRIGGAKNAALPALAAALLTDEPVRLTDLPDVADLRTLRRLLEGMGVRVTGSAPGPMTLDASGITSTEAPYNVVRTMRASILVLGPLVARFGEAFVSLPGGCAIGERPVDLHIAALTTLGARISVEKGYINAHISRVGSSKGRLQGGTVSFSTVTVTGTENVMMAAALADGTTTIENAAREPEVVDLAELLLKMGARIQGAGTPTIVVEGVERLHGTGDDPHPIVPDRIEAGTYLAAGAISNGDVTVDNVRPAHLAAFLDALRRAGVSVAETPSTVRVSGAPTGGVDVTTEPFPGFATDLQAQAMALLTQAPGLSRIHETIFENRFLHAAELRRLGADIRLEGNTAIIAGGRRLQGAPVTASDLRASAALVLAGLAASGETLVRRIYHLDRGYSGMEAKLAALGADVTRVSG